MPEIRQALPYISHLVLTKRVTQKWVPTGRTNEEGQELFQQGADVPGIQVEVIPYYNDIAAAAKTFQFPEKGFFERAVAELEAIPKKTQEQIKQIENLGKVITQEGIIWAEDVLTAGGLPSLKDLWAGVYSVALDEFTDWEEPAIPIGGIPLYVQEMQWNARIPANGQKSILLKVGLFDNDQDKGMPALQELLFEDAATRTQRQQRLTQIDDMIAQRQQQLTTLDPDTDAEQITGINNEIANYEKMKAEITAVEYGSMGSLLSNAEVQASLPALLLSIIGALKAKYWPELDMALVQAKLAENLTNLVTASAN